MEHSQNTLYPFHIQSSNNSSNSSNGIGNNSATLNNGNTSVHHHPYHSTPTHQHHEFQQELLSPTHPHPQQQQQQPFHGQHHLHTPQHDNNNSFHGSHPDLQKTIPHQMEIYQQPQPPPQGHELVDPLLNRHLNTQANTLQSSHHHQHHHYQPPHTSQAPPYYYQQQQQQPPPPQHKQYPDQHPDPNTPVSIASSALNSGSAASTPSLSSPASALPYQNSDYAYISNNPALPHLQKHTSPTASFHVPTAPTAPTTPSSGPRLGSPSSAQNLGTGLPLAMAPWTTSNASSSEQDMQPRQHLQQQSHAAPPPSHPHPQQQAQQQYSQSARELAHLSSFKGDRSSYHQVSQPQQASTHLYSPQIQDQQQQHHSQQHHAQMWIGDMSSESFHSPPEFLEQSDRQPHKQPRPFGAPDSADHPVHNPPYTTTGNYMNSHNAPGHERPRVQSGRHHALDRNILDYSESYNPHGQEPPLVTHHTGMAFLDDMSLLSPSHPSQTIQPDPQGQSFHPMLLNTGTSKNRISGSLDSVPMGLASPAIIPHPDYGAVASYVHTPTAFVSKGRSSGSGGGGDALPSRPLPQRTQSAGGRITSTPKLHRTRTGSAISSSSSLGSSAVVPPTTSALGIANSSFASSSSVISTAAGNPPNTGATTAIGTGSGVDMDEGISVSPSSSFSSSASKPRPNNHPRKAVAARVYECTFPGCNKAYTQLHNLKSHERTGHTPVQKPKPFLCIISGCTKAFSQRKSLALHIRASHKEYKFKPFKCAQPGCQKSYTQLHNLRTHEKTVHMLDLSKKRIRNPAPNTESTEENMIGVHEDDEASDNDKNKKSSNINNDKNINNATIDHVHQDEVVATSNSEGHSISNFSSRGYNCNSSNKGSFEQRMELNYRNINELGGYGARREAEGTYEDEGHEGNIKNGGYVND